MTIAALTTRKRPIIISIFAVTGFIISAFQIILISYPGLREIEKWYPVVYGLLTAFRFIALVGVWHMKKWGAELFAYSLLGKIAVQIGVNDFTMLATIDTILSAVFAIVFMCFWKRMDRNL
ncbi:MAG TPA: hypothetical protein VI731_04340 [Bacteroidia bacterium]|nr:hypothetical protein [Bacteroidia bacterium]